jgi:hypothetical protein
MSSNRCSTTSTNQTTVSHDDLIATCVNEASSQNQLESQEGLADTLGAKDGARCDIDESIVLPEFKVPTNRLVIFNRIADGRTTIGQNPFDRRTDHEGLLKGSLIASYELDGVSHLGTS